MLEEKSISPPTDTLLVLEFWIWKFHYTSIYMINIQHDIKFVDKEGGYTEK